MPDIRQIPRREFLAMLAAGSAAGLAPRSAEAQPAAAPVRTIELNHIAFNCLNTRRSRDFYRGLFGTPIQARQSSIICLRIGDGPQFIGIAGTGGEARSGYDHFCMTVENFEPARLKTTLEGIGLKTKQTYRQESEGGGGSSAPDGTLEFYVYDPDTLPVQLQHVSYAGGAGMYGEILQPVAPVTEKPPLSLRRINHVTLAVSDVPRTVAFYRKTFGLPIQTKQGAVPILGVGPSSGRFHPSIGLVQVRGGAKPGINHVCFGIDDFDPVRVMGALRQFGIKPTESAMPKEPLTATVRWRKEGDNGGGPGAPMGTPELYFTDPDGNLIQLQDVSYCGGSGVLGNVCSA